MYETFCDDCPAPSGGSTSLILTGDVTGDGGLNVSFLPFNNPTTSTSYNQNLVLAGDNNTYTGLTTVTGGTLQIGGTTEVGKNGGSRVDVDGKLTVEPTTFSFVSTNDIHLVGDHPAVRFALPEGEEFTYEGQITSEGHNVAQVALYKDGSGTLNLFQDQSYTGETQVNSGTLQIGNGGTTGSIGTGARLNISDSGTVILDRSDDQHWTYADTSGGESVTRAVTVFSVGTFIKKNDNTLILESISLHGTNKIEGGTLQLGNGKDTIGSASMGEVTSNGTFEISEDASLVIDYDIRENVKGENVKEDHDAGNFVTLGPNNEEDIKEENPTISGDGKLIKNGTRTLILTGYVTHTGETTVNEGTLQLGHLGLSTSQAEGAFKLESGTSLRTGSQTNTLTDTSSITGGGNLVANYSLNTANGDNYCVNSEGMHTCTTTLSGALDYTGSTEVKSGTLAISGSASLANTSELILNEGTTFTDNTSDKTQILKSLAVYGASTYGGSFSAQSLSFHIPNTTEKGDTLLIVQGTANIQGSELKVVLAGNSSPLQIGDEVNLISATSLVGQPADDSSLSYEELDISGSTGRQGALIAYGFDHIVEGTALRARVSGARIRAESKALSEGHLSGSAALVRSADFIAMQGIAAARSQLAQSYGADDDGKEIPENGLWGSGIQPFFAHGGGRVRHNTGSYIEGRGYNFLFGAVSGRRAVQGEVISGVFLEYGKGEYHAYNAFAAGEATGDGNTHHRGGGLFGRIGMDSGLYLEASLRRGKIDTKFKSDYLRDSFGTQAAYTSKAAYIGAHLGVGKLWSLERIYPGLSLDAYGQALWTRQDADTVTLSTGERVSFDRVSSKRLKAGARIRYDLSKRSAVYAGLAYDQEFAGKAKAKLTEFGAEIPAPEMTGGTGIVELGFLITPERADSPLSVEFGVQGYTGKREGFTGSLQFNYYF
jgi:autotransporter-associated beta strand protein